MFKHLKFLIYTRPFIWFAYYLIKGYNSTFRLKVENEDHWKALLEQGKPVLLCTWHQQFLPPSPISNSMPGIIPD